MTGDGQSGLTSTCVAIGGDLFAPTGENLLKTEICVL